MILLTHLRQPETGAILIFQCKQCRCATFMYSEHAVKPEDGDAWLINDVCPNMLHEHKEIKFDTLTLRPPFWTLS